MTQDGLGRVSEAPAYAMRLRLLIEQALPVLNEMSESEACRRPGPGKWCPKEIIGHLVDSACNNHARFVRGQIETRSMLEGGVEARVNTSGGATT